MLQQATMFRFITYLFDSHVELKDSNVKNKDAKMKYLVVSLVVEMQ